MLNLLTPIEKVKGIGPSFLSRMKKIGIKNIKDLIFYFPSRYEDFSRIISISEIKINEICTVKGKIAEIKNERTWKKRMLITQAFIKDETGMIKAVWFNQPYLTKILKKGDEIFISGRVAVGKKEVYFSNPVFEKKYKDKEKDLKHTGRIVPVYSEKTGVSSRWLRFILKPLLERIKKAIPETLPEKIIKENNLFPLNQALWQIHFPDSLKMAQKAKERFSFEELFLIHLFVLRERLYLSQERAVSFKMKVDLIKRFVDSLPFKLTDAQKKASYIILKDLEKNKPMNRLLEGDVGSGKTVVAAIAALNVIKHRYQVAFMAPTEILANQHFNTIFHLLKDFNVVIGILTGKKDRLYTSKLKNDFIEISRRKILEKTLKGEIDMLIGTHALIQDKVKFKNLGLVILDEQHRFGVEQRARLCQKEKNKVQFIPHLLSMTATPIPRTLALTIYGDLDLSLLDEMPFTATWICLCLMKCPKEEKK